MRVREGPGPARLRQGGSVRLGKSARVDTATRGYGYDLPPAFNRPLLDDDGGMRMLARPDIRRLRRHYADIVGRTAELRIAGSKLHAAARKNALAVMRLGKVDREGTPPLVRTIKMRRQQSLNGGYVDYEVYSDHPAILPIEFGYVPRIPTRGGHMIPRERVPGHYVLTNAAKNLPPKKVRGLTRGKRVR